jgi:HEAT repeat protein
VPRSFVRRARVSVAALAVVLAAGVAAAQGDAARVTALLRELKNPDFDRASAAADELHKYPQLRQPIVAGLIDAVRTGAWNRCGGDMRDAIAAYLGELKATEAVVPLIEVVKSGKSIEHECVE